MILEVAILQVKGGLEEHFENDFKKAGQYIRSIPGYIRHSLRKCMEQDNKYLLLVEWQTLRDHTHGFRNSSQYEQWKTLLHHYYAPFPLVEHYETIIEC